MVIDALGVPAEVGQRVVFGQANKGAQPLRVGVISKVTAKTATIEYECTTTRCSDRAQITIVESAQRVSGAFAVVQS